MEKVRKSIEKQKLYNEINSKVFSSCNADRTIIWKEKNLKNFYIKNRVNIDVNGIDFININIIIIIDKK